MKPKHLWLKIVNLSLWCILKVTGLFRKFYLLCRNLWLFLTAIYYYKTFFENQLNFFFAGHHLKIFHTSECYHIQIIMDNIWITFIVRSGIQRMIKNDILFVGITYQVLTMIILLSHEKVLLTVWYFELTYFWSQTFMECWLNITLFDWWLSYVNYCCSWNWILNFILQRNSNEFILNAFQYILF